MLLFIQKMRPDPKRDCLNGPNDVSFGSVRPKLEAPEPLHNSHSNLMETFTFNIGCPYTHCVVL